MGGLLAELGKKLAERWLTLLVLPGALFLATLGAAAALGHAHAFDVRRLTDRVDRLATTTGNGRIAVLLAAALLASAAAGLAAQAAGSLAERWWLAADWSAWPGPLRWPAARWTARRQRRWAAAAERYEQARRAAAEAHVAARLRGGPPPTTTGELDDAYRRMTGIAAESPARPTWMGDRVHAVAVRLDRDLGLGLAVVWPYVWLVAPDPVRTEITAARTALSRAGTLAGWALLYLGIGVLWWPAVPVAAVTAVTARHRARAATDAYALLVEAAVRLHAAQVVKALGAGDGDPVTPEAGWALTTVLRGRSALPGSAER
ncbi:hypothetical protein Dfulv_28775 [Dactylosporangium fulvum]|uniref:Vegetative cell wall protein gp1 n=1 Tax=Dactylosporangium fulvum TaxID=53359 RepID=A0ABY5VN48_9ACTN|nr:hypothetical protein [Dactylosporangium fulvum]UWP79158.1 hypothetical protein Dfulv_28775 [Dactylosporangium fulvum]